VLIGVARPLEKSSTLSEKEARYIYLEKRMTLKEKKEDQSKKKNHLERGN